MATKGEFTRAKVKSGSTLQVRVSPAAPPPAPDLWHAKLFLLRRSDAQPELDLDNAELRAGVEHQLVSSAKESYRGQITLTFAGPSRARVQIQLLKPDGTTPHGDPYDEVHSSAPGDAIKLFIRTT